MLFDLPTFNISSPDAHALFLDHMFEINTAFDLLGGDWQKKNVTFLALNILYIIIVHS
jgi:hypothetical protein